MGLPDNRDSHYWFARYWADALAAQTQDAELATHFAPIAQALGEKETAIVSEMAAVRGNAVDIGGYYHGEKEKIVGVMRSSATLTGIIG